MAACAAGTGTLSPRARDDRDQRRRRRGLDDAATRSQSSDTRCGESSASPGGVRNGHTCPTAENSTSFPISPGRRTPPAFLLVANASPQRRFVSRSSSHGKRPARAGLAGLPGDWGRAGSVGIPMSGETFLYVEPGRHPTWQFAAKRAVDVLGAAIGLLIAAPILLLAWIAIRLEDGGPALYRQVRIGLNERPFVVYKLRTMALDADSGVDSGADQRTHRWSSLQGGSRSAGYQSRRRRARTEHRRASSALQRIHGDDEFGGPRPALPEEVAQFDPELLRRHGVKPGITGLWQLEARDNPSFHAYRRLDLLYVDNWSIGLDLFILLATMPMVIAHAMSISRPERKTARGTDPRLR